MLNYYLFSFDTIKEPILISEKLGISLSNVNERDKKIIFHHIHGTLSIVDSNYIKNKDQLSGLIKISFNNKEYDALLEKSKSIDEKRKKLYAEEEDINLRHQKDEKLYADDKKSGDNILELISVQKNYLNVILICTGLFDCLIDLSNFTTDQKVKFDLDLNFYDTFKFLRDANQEFPNGRKYLNYLDFSVIQEILLLIGSIIDNTVQLYDDKQKFKDSINHIGELIQIYFLAHSDKIKLTSLVSILEYLLVRKADPKKVCNGEEDGITKQFEYKVYKAINTIIKGSTIIIITEKDIKDIYSLRSDIVHGNTKVTKIQQLENLLGKTKIIVSLLLKKRIEDPEYYHTLKNIKKV